MNRRGRERRSRPLPAPVERRTPYALAEIVAEPARPSARTLLLDGREAGQVDLADPRRLAFAYMRRIADLIDAFRPPGSAIVALHLGGGAFALPRYLAATRPGSRSEVFELDPEVVRLAREHLGLRASPRLRVRVGDAADLLRARPDRCADLVIGDAFDGPEVPAQLSGPDFAAEVRRVLRPAGVYALNVIDVPPLDAVRAHAAVLAGAFAQLAAVAPAGVLRGRAPGNVVLLASGLPLPIAALRRAATAAVPREQVLEGGILPGVIETVKIGALHLERFEEVLDAERFAALRAGAARAREAFAGRAIWNVNSTARGGGVAEMLVSLLAYARGAGVDARWAVISGDEPFFHVTKRLHNHLHGAEGDGGALDDEARAVYERALAPNAEELCAQLDGDDIVILHDPQTAGLIGAVKATGVRVIWRCHIGVDEPNDIARGAWAFLEPYVREADAVVFSREAFEWEGLEGVPLHVIAPSIDAFAPKNQELDAATVDAILVAAGLVEGETGGAKPAFTHHDGSPGRVQRRAEVWRERALAPGDRYLLQVSRWDSLKDPLGVIDGFVEHVAPHVDDVHLVYAGPAVEAVSDDPEGREVLDAARARREELPDDVRARVHLAALPMDDLEENAAIVNALQRRAAVVAQKSIAEGFGLTVAEAMWKGRPVVATRIGGIHEQIVDGESGRLLDDPHDLAGFGALVTELLTDTEEAERVGAAARERVRDEFLAVRHLLQYLELLAPAAR